MGAGVRKPPKEQTAGGVARWRVRRYGDLAAVSASTTFAIWHELCEWVRLPFAAHCNFRELGVVKKAHYYNLRVMCMMAALVPHRSNKYFHVMASNGIVSSSGFIYHDCISNPLSVQE